ncbi:hypothetical protein P154DRAFT_520750 [Amniculicola lignicola CBS 123094]|uniref:Essential protein Yae1 N-terminal domain-containing protein n=1 Tax=Amniculicola lignicola CBS 123094 TaxID=1392246 RepID=A0A6A5WYI9_9PLEO|nr:hypothetical protein P154DRAFT_520750 [Amniculicola lignicola CBS 123094]
MPPSQVPNPNPDPDPDPFTTLLHLEDTLYTSAYTSGTLAGARAGRIEGRVFGLEKGFEKFAALGVLHGRACVWGGRTASNSSSKEADRARETVLKPQRPNEGAMATDELDGGEGQRMGGEAEEVEEVYLKEAEQVCLKQTEQVHVKEHRHHNKPPIPPLPPNPRLQKHISTLHALSDPPTFSTSNTEDSVADFDDRFKRAGAKVKVIERIVGETGSVVAGETLSDSRTNKAQNGSGSGSAGDNFEDFTTSRFLR